MSDLPAATRAGGPPDLLGLGSDEVSGRSRRPERVVALAAVAVLALGLAQADRLRLADEREALAACVTAGQASLSYSERRVAGVVQYTGPLLLGPGTSPAVRADLEQVVRDTARAGLPAVERALERCARAPALPWHGDVRTARDAYLTYARARAGALAGVARDFGQYGRAPQSLPGTRRAAAASLTRVFGPQGVDPAWQLD